MTSQQQAEAVILWLLRLEDRSLSGAIRNLDDGAGLTRFGITSRYDNQFVPPDYWHASTSDALRMAVAFYQSRYWDKLRLSELLDITLAAAVLSAAVNDGAVTAVRLLQAAIGTSVDGGLGNRTIAAANAKPDAQLLFTEAQVKRYYSLVQANPADEKFIVGWISRARAIYPALPS